MTCNGFNRSHRMKEIMSMCADRRGDFSADEYHHHHHDHSNSGNEQDAAETDTMTSTNSIGGATSNRRSWSSSYLGGASRCWSCTATDRETDEDDDDNDDDNKKNANADETHCRRTSKRQLSWIRKLNRKFRNSRDSR